MGIEVEGLEAVQSMLNALPDKAKSVLRMSLNDAAKYVETQGGKAVRERWNLKVGQAKQAFKITRATNETLTAMVETRGGSFSLLEFGPTQYRAGVGLRSVGGRQSVVFGAKSRSGVSVKILRGRQTRLPRAFIATMKSGHSGVFQREPGAGRLKIKERRTVSFPSMVRRQWPAIEGKARAYLVKRVQQQLARALERAR